MESIIYILSKKVYFCFVEHNFERFSSNTGKVHFDMLVHSLIYFMNNRNLGLKYYANIEDVSLPDILIQASIKYGNQLMALSDYR